MNKAIVCGNLGQDPEVRTMENGNTVCNFSIATTERYTDKSGEKKEQTEWHRIVVWGTQAENCGKFLTKGRQALVEGKIRTRSYEKDGVTKYATEIVASNVQFLGGGNKTEGENLPF